MKKFAQNIKMAALLIVTMISLQSCTGMYAESGDVVPQKKKYVIFTERPAHENMSGPKGLYQDQDGDGLADLRYGNLTRPYTANKDDYEIDKILYYPEIVLWDGNPNHPYEFTGEVVGVAFGPISRVQINKPIAVIKGNVLYSTGKNRLDQLNQNTAGESTYVVATGF